MRKYLFFYLALTVMMVFIAGCEGGSDPSSTTSQVRITLGDAPMVLADGTRVDSVYVPIAKIILLGTADNEGTSEVLYDGGNSPTPLNLLSLANLSLTALHNNPIATSLGTHDVPAGHYSQMRLILGSGAYVMVHGNPTPVELKVPSGMETGLKVKVNMDLGAGTIEDLYLDFNLSKLNYQAGPNRFILPPNALRLVKLTQTANVAGNVTFTFTPGHLADDVTVKFTLCDTNGNPILLNGVPDTTIDTIVVIQHPVVAGDVTVAYNLNAISTAVGTYQLKPTVWYGGVQLSAALTPPIALTVTSGVTTTHNFTIAVQ